MNKSHIFHWFALKEFLSNITGAHYPLEIIALIISHNYKQIRIESGFCYLLLIKENVNVIGLNETKQLYIKHNTDTSLACSLSKIPNIISIRGCSHIIILTDRGECYGWGCNFQGQLGIGFDSWIHSPQKLNLLNITFIDCGGNHTVAITKFNHCYVWGNNESGQLGLGCNKYQCLPQKLDLQNVISVGCGSQYTIALISKSTSTSTSNEIYVWGKNDLGQLGLGNILCRNSPTKLDLLDIISVSCGLNHTCALTTNGILYGWGINDVGQLGLGNNNNQYTPHQIKINSNLQKHIVSISCGYHHTSALTKDSELYFWGCNQFVQFDLEPLYSTVPRKLVLHEPIRSIYCVGFYTFAVTNRDRVYVWGKNNREELDTMDDHLIPTELTF